MKIADRLLLTALVILTGAISAFAFPTTADVKVENISGGEVTLISSASAQKAKEAESLAVEQAFYALLHQGVEGLHGGQPMLAGDAKTFEYSFYKEAKHLNFLAGNPVKLDEVKIGDRRKVRVSVTIEYEKLLRTLRDNKQLISPAWSDNKQAAAGPVPAGVNPTIVVVPYVKGDDRSFSAMKHLVDNSPATRHAVGAVASMFSDRGFKTRDFIARLDNANTSDILRDGTQTDARTAVTQELPGDIVVYVDYTMSYPGGRRGACTVNIKAVEQMTEGELATAQYASGEYMITDSTTLINHALQKAEKGFFDKLTNAFNRMVETGREMRVEMTLDENVTDWDFDTECPETGDDFRDALEEWLRTVSTSTPDLSVGTSKSLPFNLNIPLWDKDKNRSYTINNFRSSLRKFIKAQLGDSYKVNVTNMGQKLFIVIE